MNRLLTSIVIACGVAASSAGWAQGGYTVMGNNPGPVVQPTPAVVAAPAPAAGLPSGPVEQVTASRERAPRGPGSPVAPRRPEEYGGVTPGTPMVPPGLRRARRPAGAVALAAWPGFQVVPGGSRVFVVLTSPQPVGEVTRNGRTRVFHLPNTRILLSNNRRPLITEAFETPLSRAYLRAGRGGTELVLELRGDVEPTITQETSAQGFHFVFWNFPTFAVPELARIQLPGGAVVSVPQPNAGGVRVVPTPQVQVGAPQPGTDTERPPNIR